MRDVFFILMIAFSLSFSVEAAEVKTPAITLVNHPVSTSNPQAQQYFNEGLTQIFAFNHDLAFLKFQKASEADPQLAMAYWGMALALGQNINQDITPANEKASYTYSRKALALLDNASPVEQAYIQALAVRYTDDPKRNLIELRHRYCDAMKKLVESYPEDLDATCLYVESILDLNPWRYWTWDGKPKEGTMDAIELLQSVLNRDPNNMAANHFYIHAWEESPTPERALLSAYRLTTLFPYGGHLLHMPCHIFILCGFYENAVETSKRAIEVDRRYIQKYGMEGPYPLHYLTHNLKVLSRVYLLWGNYEGALQTANELKEFVNPYYKTQVHLARNLLIPLEVNLYFQKWQEVLHLPIPDTRDLYVKAFFHFGRALASIRLGDQDSYYKEKESMLDLVKQLPPDEEVANNPTTRIMELASYVLSAEEVRSNPSEYIKKLEQAVDFQDRLDYDEPPPWYLPLRLELGAALLENKQFAEAEKVFRKGLQEYKRNGRFLKGLYDSLKGQNQEWNAFWVGREASNALYN